MQKPTKQQLEAARDQLLPDVLAPDLDLLFVGINPSLYSAATGFHFARPGNRFWPSLFAGGITARQLQPREQAELLDLGCGLTNVAPRATARADELSAEEIRAGYRALSRKVSRRRIRHVAFLGVTTYRLATENRSASLGRQQRRLGGASVHVLPNPSGLNAHYQLDDFAELFRQLAESVWP